MNGIFSTINSLSNLKLSTAKFRLVCYSILTGILTGIIVVLYRISLDKVIKFRNIFQAEKSMAVKLFLIIFLFFITYIIQKLVFKNKNTKFFIAIYIFEIIYSISFILLTSNIIILALIILSGILIQLMLNFMPLISGSGIPQVMGLIQQKLKFNWFYELILKFFGGVLSIFSGLSLGREGPSIHLGALVADGINKVTKRNEIERKYLVTSGAAAGLSAAFNAPLAGTIFVLEELHKFFSPLMLICAILASISANLVSILILGEETAFINFKQLTPVSPTIKGILFELVLILFLSIVMVIFGKIFNISLLKFQEIYKRIEVNKYIKMIIALFISYIVIILLPDITGGGNLLIEKLLTVSVTTKILLILLLFKFLFTMFSYSTGAPGGIFLPMLVIGALIGRLFGIMVVNIFNMPQTFIVHYMLIAMAAYFTAIVRAPITGIILILEMTGNFSNLFSLTIVSALTFIISELMKFESVYEELFSNMFRTNKNIEEDMNEKMTAIKIPVITNSKIVNKKIMDIKWPTNLLVIGIERNNSEFIPKGDTLILDGDKLIVFTDIATAVLELEEILDMSIRENMK
ncbi:ClC family H(+)/Cl(-) exchange transporter [Caviibacter abscessus]|uniref:ClC family H(+)/Cl(-) exchange transporter n=1 Tax=Caviibacter abscessus TaxID=1766719 RepID=UPI000A3FED41|nr:ClC family H(+)/Cl(-) exchange transporter [Caviibacter abscessus]